MTKDEFLHQTDISLAEVYCLTERYVDVNLEGKELRFRVAERLGDLSQSKISRDDFIEHVWSDEGIPYEIRLLIVDVTDTEVVVAAFLAGRLSHSDPKWEERLGYAHPSYKPYLPYLIRMPSPPTDWRLNDKGEAYRQGREVNMELSLAANGRYPFLEYDEFNKLLSGKKYRAYTREDLYRHKAEIERQKAVENTTE